MDYANYTLDDDGDVWNAALWHYLSHGLDEATGDCGMQYKQEASIVPSWPLWYPSFPPPFPSCPPTSHVHHHGRGRLGCVAY